MTALGVLASAHILEMGMTASRKLKDPRSAGLPYIAFGVLAPNLFATIGVVVAHA